MNRSQSLTVTIFVSLCLTGVLLLLLHSNRLPAATPASQRAPSSSELTTDDQEALELGKKVLAVKTALESPCELSSMKAVKDLGHDSRYYVLTRGWIQQHLKMAESYRDTAKYRNSADEQKRVEQRIQCLQKMIRTLDLE